MPIERDEWFDDEGKSYWAPHERTTGRKDARGNFDGSRTKALAAYPRLLNRALAAAVASAIYKGEAGCGDLS